MMVSAIRGELREVYRNQSELNVLEYSRNLSIDEPSVKKLYELAGEFAQQKEGSFTDQQIEKVLDKKIGDFAGIESFIVNEKQYGFEGTEQKPFVVIEVGDFGGIIFFRLKTGIASMVTEVRLNPKTIEEWQEILDQVGKETLTALRQKLSGQKATKLRKWIELLLIDELLVTSEQVQPLRDWLEKHIDDSVSGSIYQDAKDEIVGLDFELPECFSDVQKEAFRHLKARYGH